jgi:hypothetical protein
LQHGRHNRGLGRNLDRRRALLCAADGRLGRTSHEQPSEHRCFQSPRRGLRHILASDCGLND